MPIAPTLLISRRPREIETDWRGARSWFGGAPKLGDRPWPRDEKRAPLHFVAQIDFPEIAAKTGSDQLPEKGSLAFFIGGDGAVIFVPEGRDAAPTPPPADTSDLSEIGAGLYWSRDLDGQPLFPFWPIEFHVLDLGGLTGDTDNDDELEAFEAAMEAAVERHFPRGQTTLTADAAFEGPLIPDWWRNAIHYATSLADAVRNAPARMLRERQMLDHARKTFEETRKNSKIEIGKAEALAASRNEPKHREDLEAARKKAAAAIAKAERLVALYEDRIDKAQRVLPVLQHFASEVAEWTRDRDPWTSMTRDEMAKLSELWARKPEFVAITDNHAAFPIGHLKKEMFESLPVAGTDAYAALPGHVREVIDARRAPHPQWWLSAIRFANDLARAGDRGIDEVLKQDLIWLERERQQLRKQGPKGLTALFAAIFGRFRRKSEDVLKREARIGAKAAEIEKIRSLAPHFQTFVRETSRWAAGHDRFELMEPSEIAELRARIERVRREFIDFTRYRVASDIKDLEAFTLQS